MDAAAVRAFSSAVMFDEPRNTVPRTGPRASLSLRKNEPWTTAAFGYRIAIGDRDPNGARV